MSILASNDHKTKIIEFLIIYLIFFIYFLFNVLCFIESAEQVDTYLYIILDLNIFFSTILHISLRRNFKVLSYKVFIERHAE